MTMIVVLATMTGLYMAGDSRQYPVLNDTREKIQSVGKDAIIGEGGIGVIPGAAANGSDWDALTTLKIVAGATQAGTFAQQLLSIRDQYGWHFSEALSKFHGEIRKDPPSRIDIFFAKRDAKGRNYVALQQFHVKSAKLDNGMWRHAMESGQPLVKMDGVILDNNAMQIFWNAPYGCNVKVDAAGPFVNGHEAEWLTKFINQTAAQSPECAAQIGGQIRIALIDKAEVRFIAK